MLYLKTIISFLGLIFIPLLADSFEVPSLRAPVTDQAKLLSSSQKRELNLLLRSVRDQGGPQMAILTVNSLNGRSIEGASIDVVDRWKLGSEKNDDGVLILIALKERKMRIEVGQGLEGSLTDAHSKRIIHEIMRPLFKQGSFFEGLLIASHEIVKKTAPDIHVKKLNLPKDWKNKKKKSKASNLIYLLFLLFIFIGPLFGRRGGSHLFLWALLGGLSGSRSSGFGGGGFGGGGGWSGGGGGFSGGGASGGW